MKPVNLLPQSQRRRTKGAGLSPGRSNAVLGVLAVLLIMAVAYVMVGNQASSRQTEIARANAEAADARARAATLAPYAQFSNVRQVRLDSVRRLAGGRFDWERLMRELAALLPRRTYLINLTASTKADTGEGTVPGAPPAAAAQAPPTPTVKLEGCARKQPDVAVLLVRLRKLHGAKDVELTESRREEGAGGSGPPSAGTTPSTGGETGTRNCGKRYHFDVTVSFEAPVTGGEGAGERVPAALGGGG